MVLEVECGGRYQKKQWEEEEEVVNEIDGDRVDEDGVSVKLDSGNKTWMMVVMGWSATYEE